MNAVERVLAKHRQARVHLEAFQKAKESFTSEKPYRLAGQFNPDCTEYIICVYDAQPIPESINLIAGDVIHNARCCLDHLAFRIVKNPCDSTTFQIKLGKVSDGRGGFRHPTIDGGLSTVHQKALISVQPYITHPADPQNAPLAILQRLDITDKHRVVLACASATEASYHGISGYRGVEPEIGFMFGPLKDGGPVAHFRFSEPSPQVKVDFDIIPSVSLGETGAAQDAQDAMGLLWTICEIVENTVHAFEPF